MSIAIPESSTLTRDGLTSQELYDKCVSIASNLWWVWSPDAIELFRDIDPVLWRQFDHNPVRLLREFTPAELDNRASQLALYSRINQCYRLLKEYLADKRTWGANNAGVLGARPVAFFSAEFGIHESMPIYSGGLGVLSGDHMKSASDLGVPMVGVGLLYGQGYFRQLLDKNGIQDEAYVDTDRQAIAMCPALDVDHQPVQVGIETRVGTIFAKVWQLDIGRVRLYLLDCDVDGNSDDDRKLTSRLYGGDERTKIRQELVLGVGGVRALNALGITPGIFHLNEGHSAFGPLEVIRHRMEEDGLSFENAVRDVAQQTVFTTHTPIASGHDRFNCELVEEHLGPLRDALEISYEQMMGLGRVDPQNKSELFCMTVIGLKLSRKANAVSQLHGHVSRRMWSSLWPWRVEEEVPIGHITNGVHVPSWLSVQMRRLYDRYFSQDWMSRMGEPDIWSEIYNVDPGELWETHNILKTQMIRFVRQRVSALSRRHQEEDKAIEKARKILDPNVLTLGFAARFETYQRASLIFRDFDRIDQIVNNSQRPVQLIFAGKAHPKNESGKQFIQSISNLRHDPRFRDSVVFIEDYDINVCRHLIWGVDVWLNNPRRPMDASGTSGQKVIYNGGLNFSVLDGWWSEAFNGTNGFAIGNGTQHVDDDVADDRDALSIYETLEKKIVPSYYLRDSDGLPNDWINRMMNSIATLAWRFSSHRMIMDYTRECYVPAAGGKSCEMNF
ncbi:alpha-glucan family phosphorylase [Pirellulaceae bacterium]|jgi:starch phosphorylase|nr:alpha-glucan family phosphorylase [Pirellulaceae bacterium]